MLVLRNLNFNFSTCTFRCNVADINGYSHRLSQSHGNLGAFSYYSFKGCLSYLPSDYGGPNLTLKRVTSQLKNYLHYEIDRSDMEKNQDIVNYFNQNSSSVKNNFFDPPMNVAPIFTLFSRTHVNSESHSIFGDKVY